MKKREYPKNPDCPLTVEEQLKLDKVLDEIEWKVYLPLKHLTSAWAEAKVVGYNENEIDIEVKTGVDSQGSDYTYDMTLNRFDYSLEV